MTPEIRKLAEDLLALAGKATIEWLPGYEIAPDGSVWSNIAWRGASHRRLTPYPNSHGYLRVRVMLPDGVRKSCFVHKLVAEAFLPPRPSPSHEIRHLNGDRVSNSASNLAWGTRKENAADRKAHGRDMGAENGRSSAHKLRGRKRTHCKRGHDKEGRGSCEQCRRDSRNRLTVEGLSIANYIAACSPDAITKLAREVLAQGQETWRGIDSAPKGRKILLGYHNELENWRTIVGRYYLPNTLDWHEGVEDNGEDYAPEGWYEESETHEDILPTEHPPTHWQPLPGPPVKEGE